MTAASPAPPPEPALGPSAYIVLGLLAQNGPGTSYDLKRWADESVGFFWTFPRSQLYAEPQRLSALGLLQEAQEDGGRRRRTYHVTPAGLVALRAWLAQPADFPELRDLGLLKLFFSAHGEAHAVTALAAEQLALHRARLAEYERLHAHLTSCLPGPEQVQPLRMGLLYERASIAFWTEVQDGSAAPATPS
ncbi:PadR family transcriptional regulator [Deinococcus aquiradiocola]|uniref:PadR family transcriptional regulator n=1 Tax=Deinococcus aquiradiocola TaxID=393059 RepID=UPI001E56C9C6|nr:PadR family transcriptional regulator [Deinococcus aquiradiocola]